MLKLLSLLAAPVALAAAAPPVADIGTLTIHVTNVRNAKGRVHVDLCPQATFLKDGCPLSASVPAQSPTTILVLKGVTPGHYAAQLFHDENGNNKLDRGLFGIPKEGVAFSHDALKGMSAPKWVDAEFGFPGGTQSTEVRMRYFIGTAGPQGR